MKKLYRSRRDKIFAGICGGLGEYFNIDPTIVRVIWVLIILCSGLVPGLLAYIIAFFIVPKEPVHHQG